MWGDISDMIAAAFPAFDETSPNALKMERERRLERWQKIMDQMNQKKRTNRDMILATQLAKKHNLQERARRRAEYTPQKIAALHQIAAVALEKEKYRDADEIYLSILGNIEDIPTLLMLAFLRMEKAKEYDYALKLYNKVLELDPGNPWALFYSSWILYRQNKCTTGSSCAICGLANQRIVDLLRQGPGKNLRVILEFIQKRNHHELDTAILYISAVFARLPKDLVSSGHELQKMRKGITAHIELLKKHQESHARAFVGGSLDENEECEGHYFEDRHDDDDDDERERDGYDGGHHEDDEGSGYEGITRISF